jgi:mono/diheme cytochrome c family protein
VQIRGWLRNGYNAMPAVPSNWTERDIDAVLAYVKQWWTPDQQAFQAGLE